MKKRRLAHRIIDRVEYAIRQAHPEVDSIARQYYPNTLLYGDAYSDLENAIVTLLAEPQTKVFNVDTSDHITVFEV